MNFNAVIKNKVYPIFYEYNFKIYKDEKNCIQLRSSKIEINIAYNILEQSCYLSIGKIGEMHYPLTDNFIKDIFKVNFSVEDLPLLKFIENIVRIFNMPQGVELLKGNIDELREYVEKESHEYTERIIFNQMLYKIDIAWQEKKYVEFIRYLNKLDLDKLPKSYKLKYEIAKKKISI
ncbi:hypothetical protein Dip518_001571 [Parelusimicrobium proximum]|uniref:hypothetical protein n=1 Tax=Parelusimicrobium proximum TaxID=3228953 RepID=UPI003D167209